MCCEPFENRGEPVSECPDCGEPIDADGDAVYGCYYSPIECELCGSAPCDESC